MNLTHIVGRWLPRRLKEAAKKEIHRRFSEWSARVVENLNKLDFDFFWANDDHADNKAPWVNMEMYEEFFFPYQKIVALVEHTSQLMGELLK